MMKFLKSTKEDVLTLAMDDIAVIKYHLDALFAVHKKSHGSSDVPW